MKNFHKFLLIISISFTVSTSFLAAPSARAQNFIGPSQSAGIGQGAIGLDASKNLSIGTTTTQSDTKLLIVGTSTGSSYFAIKVLNLNTGPLFTVRSDGSVSIGGAITASNQTGSTTTIPNVGVAPSVGSLFVNGPIFTTLDLKANGIAVGTTTAQGGGNVYVTGSITAGGTISGSNYSGSVSAANVSAGSFGANTGGGNYSFPANVSASGYVSAGGKDTWYNANIFAVDSSGPRITLDLPGIKAYSIENSGGDLRFDGGAITFKNGGNVGIGTTGPAGIIDVRGSNSYFGINGADNTIWLRGYNNSYSEITTNAGSVSNYNNLSLYVNTANTSLPSWHMALGGILGEGAGPDSFYIRRAPTSNGTFSTLFAITNGGNVGIGTTGPSQKLEVNGNVKIGNYLYTGANSEILAGADAGGFYFASGATSPAVPVYMGGTNTTKTVIQGGNVGIGTTGPQYKLDVGPVGGAQSATTGSLGLIRNSAPADSSPYTQARIIVYGGTGVDTGNWGYLAYGADAVMRIVYGRTASPGYGFSIGTTDAMSGTGTYTSRLWIDNNGNVGIGTTGPGYKLDVTGNINGSTGVYDAGNRVYSASNPPTSVQGGFGGLYETNTGGGCTRANPLTSGCSCPSGFSSAVLSYNTQDIATHVIYQCYR